MPVCSACRSAQQSCFSTYSQAELGNKRNIANPYSMIGSVAMILENSFDMADKAKNVWAAMQGVYADGFSTADLSKPGSGVNAISTVEFGDKVVDK